MRLHNLAAILMSLIAVPASAEETAVKLDTQAEKASYAVGMDIASTIGHMRDELGLSQDLIIRGIQDTLNNKAVMTIQDANKVKTEFEQELRTKMQEKFKKRGEENLKKGQEFLEKNKTRKEVTTTASGLQYEVLKEGTGEQPKITDSVTVHYKGTLINGEEFDSSYARNTPATFPLNGVIKGWGEGVQLMKVGSKFKFYIPAELAYGATGAGQKIGPNEALIFEVELLSINDQK